MKIYKIITSYKSDDTGKVFDSLPKEIQNIIMDLVDKYEWYDFKYDGKVCHWRDGDLECSVGICPEDFITEFKKWDDYLHKDCEGYTYVYDITDEVLYGQHEYEIYGFFKEHIQMFFEEYIVKHITKDHILDKINLYGIESLTDNDKRILDGLPFIKYIDIITEID